VHHPQKTWASIRKTDRKATTAGKVLKDPSGKMFEIYILRNWKPD
jgi:hypothetical protein